MIRLDADQPDYCEGLDRPNLALIARAAIARYHYGDPPSTQRDHDHADRDPASWRRYTVRRTRWRLEREAEAQQEEMFQDLQREMLGAPCFRTFVPAPRWLGEGEDPWDYDADDF